MDKEALEKARILSQRMDEICRLILENPSSDELKKQYKEVKLELRDVLSCSSSCNNQSTS